MKEITSGAAVAEFLVLKGDEVFVEGLQGGVGEAGCAVEDSAAAQTMESHDWFAGPSASAKR